MNIEEDDQVPILGGLAEHVIEAAGTRRDIHDLEKLLYRLDEAARQVLKDYEHASRLLGKDGQTLLARDLSQVLIDVDRWRDS